MRVSDDAEFAQLSEQLLQAHRRVARLDLPAEDKARVTRRLLAVSDAAKHDLSRAAARLQVLLADLDAGRVSHGDDAPT